MLLATVLFWAFAFLLFYTYLGYGMCMWALIRIRRALKGKPLPPAPTDEQLPAVTMVIAAYNEEEYIEEKIANSLGLDYPAGKLQLLIVTDGSTDATPEIIGKYPEVKLMHQPERGGKIAAVDRAMAQVLTPITVLTDANTYLNKDAIRKLVRHFAAPRVGAVAGEKRIESPEKDQASGAGEGIYWRYESTLKRWDSEAGSVVGAAGELYAIRTELYSYMDRTPILDDFYLTMRIVQAGYLVKYEDEAFAVEHASASVENELKRKVRISAGGIQSIVWLAPMLNIFQYGFISFQYISHRVLRWTLAPLGLLIVLLSNCYLAWHGLWPYPLLMGAQLGFYAAAWAGKVLESRQIRQKALFVPYYFFIMNWSVYLGLFRYLRGQQSVAWEKAQRKKADSTHKQY